MAPVVTGGDGEEAGFSYTYHQHHQQLHQQQQRQQYPHPRFQQSQQTHWSPALAPVVVGLRNNPLFNPSSNTLLPTRILAPTCNSPTAAQRWNPGLPPAGLVNPVDILGHHEQQQQMTHVRVRQAAQHLPSTVPDLSPARHYVPHPHRQPVSLHQPTAPNLQRMPQRPYPSPEAGFAPAGCTQHWEPSPASNLLGKDAAVLLSTKSSSQETEKKQETSSSSSSSSEESFISCSEDDCRGKLDPSSSQIALVPLKDSNPDAMYLDPATETYLPLTEWMAKYEEVPRPSLLKKSPSTGTESRRYSIVSDSNLWPTSKPPDTLSVGDSRESSFAEKVKAQNRLLSASTPSHFAASPDPDPSGPLPDYQRSESFAHRSASSGHTPNDDIASTDALAEDETLITREALEQEQRIRATAAQAGCLQAQLEKAQDIHEHMDEGPAGSLAADEKATLKEQYESQIAWLKAEAEGFRVRVELEEAKRKEEKEAALASLDLLQKEFEQKARCEEREKSSILAELIRKQELMQKTLEAMQLNATPTAASAMIGYLTVATHGVTAISFRLESIAFISPVITESLAADCILYAVVRVGERDLHSRLREGPVSLSELRELSAAEESVGGGSSNRLTWNDVFHFPYLNERYLSCTVRLKELDGDKIRDYLIGSARIDLEPFILGDTAKTLQTIQTFDAEGTATSRLVISIVPSSDVLRTPCLSVKPQAMDAAAAALNATLSTSFFPFDCENLEGSRKTSGEVTVERISSGEERRASLDSVEAILTMVDWRAVSVVAHQHKSIIVTLCGLKGLKLGSRTSAAALSLELDLIGASGVTSTVLSTAHRVQVQRTKKNRLFAFINYNEEMRLPFTSQKHLRFLCWNVRAQPERSVIGEATLDLQDILLTGCPTAKRKLTLEDFEGSSNTGKRVGYLDVVVEFSSEEVAEPKSTHARPANLESRDSLDKTSSLGPEKIEVQLVEDLPPPTTCHVTIEGYRDLSLGGDSFAHPYIRVKLGTYEARTARGAGEMCRFRAADAQFAFNLNDSWPLQLLTLECFNRVRGDEVERLVGVCVLPLTDLERLPFRSFSGDLRLLNKRGEDAGILSTSCQLLH